MGCLRIAISCGAASYFHSELCSRVKRLHSFVSNRSRVNVKRFSILSPNRALRWNVRTLWFSIVFSRRTSADVAFEIVLPCEASSHFGTTSCARVERPDILIPKSCSCVGCCRNFVSNPASACSIVAFFAQLRFLLGCSHILLPSQK